MGFKKYARQEVLFFQLTQKIFVPGAPKFLKIGISA